MVFYSLVFATWVSNRPDGRKREKRKVGKAFCARHTCDLVVPHRTAHERPLRYLNVHRIEDNQRACRKVVGEEVRNE
jgi:hypothetical protein